MRATLAIVLALITAAVAIGCGDDEAPPATTVTVSLPQTSTDDEGSGTVPAPTASGEPDGTGPAESSAEDPRSDALERSATQTVRSYFEALNARDGETVCNLLAPGAIDDIKLPVKRGSCAESVTASIGYRDPRGLPVWEGTEITSLTTEVDLDSARIVADIVTKFADRGQNSIEDDLVYLTRSGPRWLIAKPSATLYRAVGIADVPVAVLSPPN